MAPLVSVVIPVFNQAEYLADAVTSVLSQTFRDLEVIVIDDGSTDNTPMVAASFGGKINYVRKVNGGTSSALNLSIDLARGEYWAWLSADDCFEPDKLRRQLESFSNHPEAGLVYTDFWVVGKHGEIRWQELAPSFKDRRAQIDLLFDRCYINGATVLLRKKLFERAGRFDEALVFAHDYDMWLRMARDTDFGHIAEPLLRSRLHGMNTSLRPDALSENPGIIANALKWYGLDSAHTIENWDFGVDRP